MRVPVHRLHGKAASKVDSEEDVLQFALQKHFSVTKQIFAGVDAYGNNQEFHALAIPKNKIVIEIDGTDAQSDKGILTAMRREKQISAQGWRICRVTKSDVHNGNAVDKVRNYVDRMR